ncbi:MAG: Na+/H+ antiporter NhaA [Vicinamibacterales bacterium]
MIARAVATLQEFLKLEAAGGLLLMGAATLAMIVANSPLGPMYQDALAVPFEIRLGTLGLAKPLVLWINDGLMAIFFLLVGMELKREAVEGHLSSVREATLPAFAAVGGMVFPALCFAAINAGDPQAMRGWAIPAATDIAFALGVMALLGPRVPAALKAFLLSIAIIDDLGAIVIIALFYTAELSTTALAVAAICVAGLAVLNRRGVTRPAAYFLLGVPLWVAVLKSGVHATLAGVVLAWFIPIRGGAEGESPLKSLEHALHPWVAFGVLPVFAFANAGVPVLGLSFADLVQPVPLGIMAGLFIGKQTGIMAMSWLAVRLGVARLATGLRWSQIYGVALLCGVGFTMSLFVASLAYGTGVPQGGLDRLGILTGSLLSGVAGYLVLRRHG